jgi:uncharacterized delta-60 repeat protein
MWPKFLSQWLARSGSTPRRRAPRRRASFCRPVSRLRVEALEDRRLLSAGVLDPSFGNGAGYVTTSTSVSGDQATSVLIQPNGDIVAVGQAATSTGPEFGVERYNPDGSLDTSFGSGGIALTTFGPGSANGLYSALFTTGTANAGDIVQEGYYGPNGITAYQALALYSSNGTLDTSFGTGGEVTTSFAGMGNSVGGKGVAVTSTGQIVTLGSNGGNQFVLARYNADGSLDTTFGTGGYVITTVPGGDSGAGSLLEQPNGDLIVQYAGGANDAFGTWYLYRFNANGALDTSFGIQGIVTTAAPGGSSETLNAALYPNAGTPNDGQIVVVGQASNQVELVRYNANGSLDATFGTGGFAQTPGNGLLVNQATIDANGRIVLTGLSGASTEVARFNANGSPDTTFGNGGVATTTIGTRSNGLGVAIYPNAGAATDGDIVVVGFSGNGTKHNVLVARYLGQATGPYFAIAGPSSVTAGTANTYTINVFNPDGSADTGYSGTVHITSSDAQAVLPADFTITGGSATFSATLKTAGVQSLTATDTVTAAITGSDAGIQVTPAAATHFAISGPSSVKSGSAFSITVTALDAYGNVATGYTGSVRLTDSASGATLPGNYTFTAADAGVHTSTGVKLKTKGMQTITATDTVNSAIIGSLTISVS